MTNRDKLIARAHDRLERDWKIINKYELYAEEMANFAIEVSKEAVDEFLAAVRKKTVSERYDQPCYPLGSTHTDYATIIEEVYAERFGGQKDENSISSGKD